MIVKVIKVIFISSTNKQFHSNLRMSKRKLDKSATESLPGSPKRGRVPGGILKSEGTPPRGHNRSVTFPPPAELEDRLRRFSRDDVEIGEDEMPSLLASLENLRGPSLILWLKELQVVKTTITES